MSHLHHKVSALIDGELRRLGSSTGARPSARRARLPRELRGDGRSQATAARDCVRASRLPTSSRPSTRCRARGRGTTPALRGGMRRCAAPWSAPARCRSRSSRSRTSSGAPETASVAAVVPPVDEANAEFAASAGGYGLVRPGRRRAARLDRLSGLACRRRVATRRLRHRRRHRDRNDAARRRRRGRDDAATGGARARAGLRTAGSERFVDYTSAGRHEVRIAVDHVPSRARATACSTATGPATRCSSTGEHARRQAAAADRVSVLAHAYDVACRRSRPGRRPAGDDRRRRATTGCGSRRCGSTTRPGVLLDRDLYDNGALVRSSRYERLDIEQRRLPCPPPAGAPRHRVDEPPDSIRGRRSEMTAGPARRRVGDGLTLTALGRVGGAGDMVEADYSDGISSASIFEQRGVLDHSALAGYRQMVVGDAAVYVRNGLPSRGSGSRPTPSTRCSATRRQRRSAAAVADLPHEGAPSDGALHRIGLGLQRIGACSTRRTDAGFAAAEFGLRDRLAAPSGMLDGATWRSDMPDDIRRTRGERAGARVSAAVAVELAVARPRPSGEIADAAARERAVQPAGRSWLAARMATGVAAAGVLAGTGPAVGLAPIPPARRTCRAAAPARAAGRASGCMGPGVGLSAGQARDRALAAGADGARDRPPRRRRRSSRRGRADDSPAATSTTSRCPSSRRAARSPAARRPTRW